MEKHSADGSREVGWDAVGAEIPGEDDCDHENFVRIGTDAGNNRYFECSTCSAVRVKFGPRESEARDRSRSVTAGDTHPLIDSLTADLDRDEPASTDRERRTFRERTLTAIRSLFESRRKE